MQALGLVVDWFGPFSLDDAHWVAKDQRFFGATYVAIGHTTPTRPKIVQYVGLSSDFVVGRLTWNHHKLKFLEPDADIWLGEIATARLSGPKARKTDVHLDLVESLHIYALKPPLNERKKESLPERHGTVFNRWRFPDFESMRIRKNRPHRSWPTVIDYASPRQVRYFYGNPREDQGNPGH